MNKRRVEVGELRALHRAKELLRQDTEELRRSTAGLVGRVSQAEREERRQRLCEIAEGWPESDKHVALMEQIAAALGEESAAFAEYVRLQRATAETLRAAGLLDDAAPPAWGEIESRAATLMKEEKLTHAAAVSRVASEDPALYNEYVAEQKRGG